MWHLVTREFSDSSCSVSHTSWKTSTDSLLGLLSEKLCFTSCTFSSNHLRISIHAATITPTINLLQCCYRSLTQPPMKLHTILLSFLPSGSTTLPLCWDFILSSDSSFCCTVLTWPSTSEKNIPEKFHTRHLWPQNWWPVLNCLLSC